MVRQSENVWAWVWTGLFAGLFGCSATEDTDPSKLHGGTTTTMAGESGSTDTGAPPNPGPVAGTIWPTAAAGASAQTSAAPSGSAGQATGSAGRSVMSAVAGAGAGTMAANTTTATGGSSAQPRAGTTGSAAGSGGTSPVMGDDIPAADSFMPLMAAQFGKPRVISTAFDLAEGPIWDHCEQRLLFTDVNNRRIHTFTPGGQVGVYMEPTNYVNGMVFEPSGRLLMAEMGGGQGGRITRMARDKSIEVIVDRSPTGGALQTTDDLALRSDGTIYFSDPIISHGPYLNSLGSLAQHPFYMLKPGMGKRELVNLGRMAMPNGIRLSRDEKALYVNAFVGDKVVRYDVAADGSLSGAEDLATGLDGADSMCLDAAGNLYVGVYAGLQVLRPDGTKVTLIPVDSARGTTNCTFGGPEGKTLFITAWNTLSQLDNAPVPGLDWHKNKHMQCN